MIRGKSSENGIQKQCFKRKIRVRSNAKRRENSSRARKFPLDLAKWKLLMTWQDQFYEVLGAEKTTIRFL
jgi:hypothetical protein